MGIQQEDQEKTIQDRIAEEDLIQERLDEGGSRWRKVYFGRGEHCRHSLEQFKELGEVQVEDVDSRGFNVSRMPGKNCAGSG